MRNILSQIVSSASTVLGGYVPPNVINYTRIERCNDNEGRRNLLKYSLVAGATTILACVKQKVPVQEPLKVNYPESYYRIEDKNKKLAHEIRRVLGDSPTILQSHGIDNLWNVYEKNPSKVDDALKIVQDLEGPKATFNSYVEAMQFLSEDDKLIDLEEILSDFSSDKLLSKAWALSQKGYKNTEMLISDHDLSMVIGTFDKKTEQKYRGLNTEAQKMLLLIHYVDDEILSEKNRKLVQNYIFTSRDYVRWKKNPSRVLLRLNQPKLVDRYIDLFIEYKFDKIGTKSIKTIVRNGVGDCNDLTHLGLRALYLAGYDTFARRLSYSNHTSDHMAGGIILPNGKYKLVVDFYHSKNDMPDKIFNSIEEVDKKIAGARKISHADYWRKY